MYEIIKPEVKELSFAVIREWVSNKYGVKISNSSITGVMQKANIKSLDEPGDEIITPFLRSEKEKYVLEAFKEYNII